MLTMPVGAFAVLLACADLTTPIRALFAPVPAATYLNPSGVVVVWPGNMRGWAFQKSPENPAACIAPDCRFTQGPGTPPAGSGSADFAGPPLISSSPLLVLQDYRGVRFDQVSDLRYANYRGANPGTTYSPALLEVLVDYDLSDQQTGAQGLIIFDPHLSGGFTVAPASWQTWDAKAGQWYGTHSSVQRGDQTVANPCVIATPCTWSHLLVAFPNIGVHSMLGSVMLAAPRGRPNGVDNYVDKFEIGIGGAVTTFDFELSNPNPVPAAAPDSVPQVLWDSIIAPANILTAPPGVAGTVIRDMIYVQFRGAATQADRQAAVDAVGGTVVGGMKLGGPEYFYAIRLPYTLQPGDSSTSVIFRARANLRLNPRVNHAIIALMDSPAPLYRRPRDTGAFAIWPVSKDSLFSALRLRTNWGQIAINAPLAWGCSNGRLDTQSRPSIAVVDVGFFDVRDLRDNIGTVRQFADPASTDSHGTGVAGIAAAVGDNGMGITGMLWDARLDLYDWSALVPGVPLGNVPLQKVTQAVLAGAKVVNMSFGMKMRGLVTNPLDSADAATVGEAFSTVISASQDYSSGTLRRKTLFVVAAGNSSANAFFSGYPAAAALDSSDRLSIVVVGAAQADIAGSLSLLRKPDIASNSGRWVDVVAPGADIFSLSKNDDYSIGDGTSLAAPFVTGLAGMLLSFDETLSSDSLRTLIIAGAVAGGRSVADPSNPTRPLPMIDAYESLKLAAQRVGGPLCGNRFTLEGSAVVVERALPDGQFQLDTIANFASIGAVNLRLFDKYHAGHVLDLYYDTPADSYLQASARYANGRWVTGPALSNAFRDDSLKRAFGGRINGASHDGDSTVYYQTVGTVQNNTYRIGFGSTANGPIYQWTFAGTADAYAAPLFGEEIYIIDSSWPLQYSGTPRTATLRALNVRTLASRVLLTIPNFLYGSNLEPSEDGKLLAITYATAVPNVWMCSTVIYATTNWQQPLRTVSANGTTFSGACGYSTIAPSNTPFFPQVRSRTRTHSEHPWRSLMH